MHLKNIKNNDLLNYKIWIQSFWIKHLLNLVLTIITFNVFYYLKILSNTLFYLTI